MDKRRESENIASDRSGCDTRVTTHITGNLQNLSFSFCLVGFRQEPQQTRIFCKIIILASISVSPNIRASQPVTDDTARRVVPEGLEKFEEKPEAIRVQPPNAAAEDRNPQTDKTKLAQRCFWNKSDRDPRVRGFNLTFSVSTLKRSMLKKKKALLFPLVFHPSGVLPA